MSIAAAAAIAVLFLALAAPLCAQPNAAPGAGRPLPLSHAARAQGALRIDGHPDEADWAAAPATDAFTQIDPAEGQPATQPTEIRVLYDDDYLYIGARMHDVGPVRARLGRRDMDPGDSDWLRVFLDSYHDHRTAFGFEVNPAGVGEFEFARDRQALFHTLPDDLFLINVNYWFSS